MSVRKKYTDTTDALRRTAAAAPMLDADTERDYLRRIQENGDADALSALLASHLRLVIAMAQRYVRSGVALEDLVAEGNLGLVEAARRFDRSRGTRFSTYASWWVRALIRRYALANRRIVAAPSTRNGRKLIASLRSTQQRLASELGGPPSREQVAQALGVSSADVAMVETALSGRDVSLGPTAEGTTFELPSGRASPEEEATRNEEGRFARACVRHALGRLDAREREIVEKRILDDDKETLSEIGSSMGLSRERVRQLELRARQKLREALLDVA